MSRAKKFGILFLAANLVPALAFGAQAKVPAPQPRDLTLEDAKSAFINFSADIVTKDTDSTAKLFGMIYKPCLEKFMFSSHSTDQGIAFQIHDKGDGANCMKDLRAKNGDQCQSESAADGPSSFKCVRLSTLVQIDLKDKDGDIGLFSIHDNEDQNREHFEKIGKLHFKSAATVAAEEEMRIAQEHSRRVEKYRHEISSCVNDESEIGIARGALASLLNMGELKDGELTTFTANLDTAELNTLYKDAETASLDDLAVIREKLIALAAGHPKLGERIATILHRVATRYWAAGEDSPEQFKLAKETITEAQALKGLKQNSVDNFKVLQNSMTLGIMDNMAKNGDTAGFYSSYQTQMNGLIKQYNKECGGKRVSMEACMDVVNTINSANQLPMKLNQTIQAKWQDQQRMQKQMQDAMNAGQPQQAGQPQAQPQMPQQQFSRQPTMYAGGAFNMQGSQTPWTNSGGFNSFQPSGTSWAGTARTF